MSADKYPSIFSRQMEAIVYLLRGGRISFVISRTYSEVCEIEVPWYIPQSDSMTRPQFCFVFFIFSKSSIYLLIISVILNGTQ